MSLTINWVITIAALLLQVLNVYMLPFVIHRWSRVKTRNLFLLHLFGLLCFTFSMYGEAAKGLFGIVVVEVLILIVTSMWLFICGRDLYMMRSLRRAVARVRGYSVKDVKVTVTLPDGEERHICTMPVLHKTNEETGLEELDEESAKWIEDIKKQALETDFIQKSGGQSLAT